MNTRTQTSCPHCEKSIKVTPELLGKRVRCPECRQPFEVASISFSGPQRVVTDEEAAATQAEWETDESEELPPLGADHPPATAPRTPTIGKVGRFELKQTLGQGSFGRVYLAYDVVLDREVALKVPRFDRSDERRVRRFLTEAKAAAQLRHPNIVTVFESGQAEDELFIASEYVAGDPLSRRISSGPIDQRQAAQWVSELADALAYAHGEGVIHRDIKPENIMISAKGRPQIMDFGLAKRIDSEAEATADGSIMGTPAYMSPEQARGDQERVGPASDQYSLGVTLYELLTGKRPFEGGAHNVIHAVLTEEPKPPRQLNAAVPRDLDAICLKAMDKEPARRYATAAAFAADLDRWLASRPVHARPIGNGERFVRWTRRNPVVAGSLAATFVVFAAGFSISLWQWSVAQSHFRQAEQSRQDADRLRIVAEANLKDANRERVRAEEASRRLDAALTDAKKNLNEANRLRIIADNRLAEVEEARREAEANQKEARKSKSLVAMRDTQVEDQKQKLESQTRRQAYLSDFSSVSKSIKQDDVVRIRAILHKWFPGTGRGDDLRGFEWHHLARTYGTWGPESLPPNRWIEQISWDGRYVRLRKTPRGEIPKPADVAANSMIWDTIRQQIVSQESAEATRYDQTLDELFQTPFSWMPLWSTTQASIRFKAGGRVYEAVRGRTHFQSQGPLSRFNLLQRSPSEKMNIFVTTKVEVNTDTAHDANWATFSLDGSIFAKLKDDGSVVCVRTATGNTVVIPLKPVMVKNRPSCWISPGGNYLAVVSSMPSVPENIDLRVLQLPIDGPGSPRISGAPQIAFTPVDKTLGEPEFSLDGSLFLVSMGDDLVMIDMDRRRAEAVTKLANMGSTFALSDAGTTLLFEMVAPDKTEVTNKADKADREGRQKLNLITQKRERFLSKDVQSFQWPERSRPFLNADRESSKLSSHAEFLPGAQSGSLDRRFNTSLLALLKGEEHTLIRAHESPIQKLILNSRGNLGFTYAENGELKVWSLPSGRPITTSLAIPTKGLNIAPADNPLEILVTRQNIIEIWDAAQLRKVRPLPSLVNKINSCCSTPDGTTIVVQTGKDGFEVWNPLTSTMRSEWDFVTNRVLAHDIQRDGRIVACALATGDIYFHRTSDGSEVNYLKDVGSAKVIRFSPDGRLLATGNDKGAIQLWDVDRGEIRTDITGHAGPVTCLAFSPDGSTFASGSADQTIKTWDLELGKERYTFEGHTGGLTALEFMPDSRTMISADKNGSLHIWRGR